MKYYMVYKTYCGTARKPVSPMYATLIMKYKNTKKNLVDLSYIRRYLKYNFNMSKLEMRSIHYVYG